MERIQSAIAKARAARQEGVVRSPFKLPSATSRNSAVQAAWASLPERVLDQGRIERNRLVASTPGAESTPFDVMRTNLIRHLREHDWTRVAITSPGSGVGKTTTCINLALSLARQRELRVVVLELDLRRPAIQKTLGVQPAANLSEVMRGSIAPEDGLVRIRPNLAIGMNSEPAANPAELLSSTQAAAAIDAIEIRYRPDVILLDMPPVLVIDDALAFLDQVDCALMVAGAEQTTVAEIDRAGKAVSDHTKVLGVILNKCRYMDRSEGYGHDGY